MKDSGRRGLLLTGLLGLFSLAALSLGLWRGGARGGGTLHLLIAVPQERRLTASVIEDLDSAMATLLEGFRNAHPTVRLQLQMFHERDVPAELARRNRSGMGPDVLYTNSGLASRLEAQGLTVPLRQSPALSGDLDPSVVRSQRLPDGRLVGLPVLLHPQLACFDRRRIKAAPTRIEELVTNSHWRVGLPMDVVNLIWSLGSISGRDGVEGLSRDDPPEATLLPALRRWLGWLVMAEQSTSVGFAPSQQDLQAKLLAGELDWIPCRSDVVHGLRRRMGPRLGLAPLPAGPGGQPSPLARTRVFSLGVNSSRRQRQLAESLLQLISNPAAQHRIGMQLSGAVPVNTSVRLPQTEMIQAIRRGQRQASQSAPLQAQLRRLETQMEAADELLAGLIFGEIEVKEASDRMMRLIRQRQP